MSRVALDIALEFFSPEIPICFGGRCVPAAFVSVPETTVDEYHSSVLRQYKIRGARKLSCMQSIAKASGMEEAAQRPFRPSVLSTNARHHVAALRCGLVAHGFGCISLDDSDTVSP